MLLLVTSLFFTSPAPLDMPRAESYKVRCGKEIRLEDRYDKTDLWISQNLIGRWVDNEGRELTLTYLRDEPPAVNKAGTLTRTAYETMRVPMKKLKANREVPLQFREAIEIITECPLIEGKPRRAKQVPRGYSDVTYWQNPTNYMDIVCTCKPEKMDTWYLIHWRLVEGDDYAERMMVMEDEFLRKELREFLAKHEDEKVQKTERELFRRDVKHSIAAYPEWHFTDSKEFAIVDNLTTRGFVSALTNEFSQLRKQFLEIVPLPISSSNSLCVARIYASREEYLEALRLDGNTNLTWSAAYWSPIRKELVAYLPTQGEERLMRTIRHEAFHQYLTYGSMTASPWINEGYAQYFENVGEEDLGLELDEKTIQTFAEFLPKLMLMDYEQFYSGTDLERHVKYRLAWSIAFFIENGAPKVRFNPFKNLKQKYFAVLNETDDMSAATISMFENKEEAKLFVSEWKRFWEKR